MVEVEGKREEARRRCRRDDAGFDFRWSEDIRLEGRATRMEGALSKGDRARPCRWSTEVEKMRLKPAASSLPLSAGENWRSMCRVTGTTGGHAMFPNLREMLQAQSRQLLLDSVT
jgi:hypothetical protein